MFRLTYNLKINNENIDQNIFLDKTTVITILKPLGSPPKKSIYIKQDDLNYKVDSENKNLSIIDFSNFKFQNEFISKEIGVVNILNSKIKKSFLGFESELWECKNNDGKLNSILEIITIPGIEHTAYHLYIQNNMKFQLIKVSLDKNQLVANNTTEITINGIKHISQINLISIEKIEYDSELLELSNFIKLN